MVVMGVVVMVMGVVVMVMVVVEVVVVVVRWLGCYDIDCGGGDGGGGVVMLMMVGKQIKIYTILHISHKLIKNLIYIIT